MSIHEAIRAEADRIRHLPASSLVEKAAAARIAATRCHWGAQAFAELAACYDAVVAAEKRAESENATPRV